MTIIGNGNTIDGKGKMRLFQITNNAKVTFVNLKFINGYYDGYEGGAICGACSVINSTFINNKGFDGGALYEGSAINCSFINNVASRYGGATDEVDVVNCTFINNRALHNGGSDGQVVQCIKAVQQIPHSSKTMLNRWSNVWGTATNCKFINNSANSLSSRDAYRTIINFDVESFNTTPYSCERLIFKYLPKTELDVKIYKDRNLINESTCISTEGWIVNLTEGTYSVTFKEIDDYYVMDYNCLEFTVTVNVVGKHLDSFKNFVDFQNPFCDCHSK